MLLTSPAKPRFLVGAPRYLFLTGKGGVGKTSVACAAAIALAGAGKRVLLVSTDPASNVGHVFGLVIGDKVTAIPDMPGLTALEIDPVQAAAAYRETIVGPVRGLLPATEVALIEEQLSGACTTEIASFNEFTALLTQDTPDVDHVVFDTAPTGHTIRLLQLPTSWTQFLDAGKGDASCLGPLAGLDKQRSVYPAAGSRQSWRRFLRRLRHCRATSWSFAGRTSSAWKPWSTCSRPRRLARRRRSPSGARHRRERSL